MLRWVQMKGLILFSKMKLIKNIRKGNTMIKKIDKKNKFVSMFNPDTGFYMRSGVIENGKDTGVDPFMTSFPELKNEQQDDDSRQ